MSYVRNYTTKAQTLIRLSGSIGVVNATRENFNISAKDIIKDENFINRNNANSGVFCLVQDELDIPF